MKFIENCSHKTTCEDSGTIVCIDCGLVIQEQVFKFGSLKVSKPNSITSISDYNSKSFLNFHCGEYNIEQICEINHINEDIRMQAIKKYYDIYTKERKKGVTLHPNVVGAYSLFFSCNKNNAIRSRTEISNMFQIPVKQLNKIENRVRKNETFIENISPSDLLCRINVSDLSFKEKRELGSISDEIFSQVCATPNAVLGFVLFKYLQRKNENMNNKKKITLHSIAKICNITPSCIKRLIVERGKINFPISMYNMILYVLMFSFCALRPRFSSIVLFFLC